MLLELSHHTTFDYSEPVSESHLEFRLTPLTDSAQHLLQHRQRVSPACRVRQHQDARGNLVTYFNVYPPHERIEVVFESVVETYAAAYRGQGLPPGGAASPEARLLLYDYLHPTPLTQPCPEFEAFVRPLEELRGAPPDAAAREIGATIFRDFRYEGALTSASSPISEVLRHGAGVCQDFAHLMLAACRHLGFAARYVSGYVLPENPTDTALASHAWCEVFHPERGWYGFDPTHEGETGEPYVRLGVGRDFRDVPPNRGLYRGAAAEEIRVQVQMTPLRAEELEQRTRLLTPRLPPPVPAYRQSRKPAPISLLEQTLHAQQQQQQQ